MKTRIVVVGAGGLAREVAWLIRELNADRETFEFVGYIVTDLTKLSEHDSRDRLLGDYSWLDANRGKVDGLAIGIGTPASRLKVAADLTSRFPELTWPSLIHPSVRLELESASVGAGAVVCVGSVGTVNIALEPYCLVNLCCTLGHEARIGAGCVLNPTVNISGGVRLGRGVLVGTGAQVLQYLEVGEGATVGAGAVVTKNVAAGETVVGIPAKPLRR